MYYTHGDTIIYRSDRPMPEMASSQERRRPARATRSEPPSVEALRERIAQLEARLERLESGQGGHWPGEERRGGGAPEPYGYAERTLDAPPEGLKGKGRGAQGRSAPPEPARPVGQVRVSLQAQGGAQATLGEVRMLQDG